MSEIWQILSNNVGPFKEKTVLDEPAGVEQHRFKFPDSSYFSRMISTHTSNGNASSHLTLQSPAQPTRFVKKEPTKKKTSKISEVRCKICNRKMKSMQGLRQHHEAKHPNMPLEVHSIFHCPKCEKHFYSDKALKMHFKAKHSSAESAHRVLIDENLSPAVKEVYTAAQIFGVKVNPIPKQMKGWSDAQLLKYICIEHMGLVTRDIKFARDAARQVHPVFLVWQNTLIKMN